MSSYNCVKNSLYNMSPHAQTTREIILVALNRSKDLTAHELSLECGIGEPGVRFHLRKLKEAGLITEFPGSNLRLKAGRTAPTYRRIPQEQNGNVDNLCKTLLKLISRNSLDTEHPVAHVIAEDILSHRILPDKPGIASMLELIHWLNQHQFAAGWEAGKQGPVIRFQNCPYRSIRSGNDILCKIDIEILQQMTGRKWEQKDHLNWENLDGECIFVVKHSA